LGFVALYVAWVCFAWFYFLLEYFFSSTSRSYKMRGELSWFTVVSTERDSKSDTISVSSMPDQFSLWTGVTIFPKSRVINLRRLFKERHDPLSSGGLGQSLWNGINYRWRAPWCDHSPTSLSSDFSIDIFGKWFQTLKPIKWKSSNSNSNLDGGSAAVVTPVKYGSGFKNPLLRAQNGSFYKFWFWFFRI